ncbi:RnaseH-domain-containing protein [Mycena leptocephala]|nr:RnaseH-domain-containing protein [Mycena leptocephala]
MHLTTAVAVLILTLALCSAFLRQRASIDDASPSNSSLRIPGSLEQTRPNAEVIAAIDAVNTTSLETALRLENPRGTVMLAMTEKLDKWEDRGWIGIANNGPFRVLAAGVSALVNLVAITLQWERGSSAGAADLAKAGIGKAQEDAIHLEVPHDRQLQVAKLSSMTQPMAYRGIKEMHKPVSRPQTDENVKIVQEAVKNIFSFHPKSPATWKSIRHKDIGRNIRNVLWKSMHGAHRVGKYWTNIPECEDRANCVHCGEVESLEHILLECPSPGQNEIWRLAEELWTKKHPDWSTVSMGSILGSGLARFKDAAGKPQPALARLYKILMTESAHIIWKLRCDSVIGRGGTPPSANEVHNRWLKIDRILTNKLKYGKQHALAPSLVLETWGGTLLGEDELPDDWLREPGVLVGIAPKKSRRSLSPPSGRWGQNR